MILKTTGGWLLSVVHILRFSCALNGHYLYSDIVAGKRSDRSLNSHFTHDNYIKRR